MSSPTTDTTERIQVLDARLRDCWARASDAEDEATLLCLHLIGLAVRNLAPDIVHVQLDYSVQGPHLTNLGIYYLDDGTAIGDQVLCDQLDDAIWAYATSLQGSAESIWLPYMLPTEQYVLDVTAACAIEPPAGAGA